MVKEEASVHDNDAGIENGVVASTSSNAIENHNADENNAAAEETVDIKPAIEHALRECHNRKRNQKKKQTKAKPKKTNAKAKRFKCNQCDYACAVKSRIKRHAQRHSTEKPFQCEHCHVRFGYVQNLKMHLLQRHNIICL